jgi:prepilin-type N-terminal cleavage/methylation domain-containing protein
MNKYRTPRLGFTLLEMSMSVAVMTVVMGGLLGLSLGMSRTSSVQHARMIATEEARRALETLTARLHAASYGSINTASLPGDVLTFRLAADMDGNGSAVNASGSLELGTRITVGPDTADANKDGLTSSQLVMVQGAKVRVLCNGLPPDSAVQVNGMPKVKGFWVVPRNDGLDVSVQAEARDNRGTPYRVSITEFATPRNP